MVKKKEKKTAFSCEVVAILNILRNKDFYNALVLI